jgi:hypothetical protein
VTAASTVNVTNAKTVKALTSSSAAISTTNDVASSAASDVNGSGSGFCACADACDHDLTDVRFIRPEKMGMCYVTAHACVLKQFLVQKLP